MTDFTDISLTSIPPRFSRLGETLESLLHQTVEIKNIWLTIPKSYKRFPNWNGVLPKVPKGIKINRINEDLGPASKIIPILKKTDSEDYILYCDDDWEYEPAWAESFIANSRKKTSAIAASTFSVKRLGKKNGVILQGFGGVLVRKKFFTATDLIITEPFTWVDDIWFSACLCKNKIEIVKNEEASKLYRVNISDEHALQNTLFKSMKRADLNKAAANHVTEKFEIWM